MEASAKQVVAFQQDMASKPSTRFGPPKRGVLCQFTRRRMASSPVHCDRFGRVTTTLVLFERTFDPCRRGDLNKLLPSPRGDSSSAPSYGCQRRDQHYQPTHRRHLAPPRTLPKPASTPYEPGAGSSSSSNVKPSARAAALATLAGELAEAYPDCRTDLAPSFGQSEASIRDGLLAHAPAR